MNGTRTLTFITTFTVLFSGVSATYAIVPPPPEYGEVQGARVGLMAPMGSGGWLLELSSWHKPVTSLKLRPRFQATLNTHSSSGAMVFLRGGLENRYFGAHFGAGYDFFEEFQPNLSEMFVGEVFAGHRLLSVEASVAPGWLPRTVWTDNLPTVLALKSDLGRVRARVGVMRELLSSVRAQGWVATAEARVYKDVWVSLNVVHITSESARTNGVTSSADLGLTFMRAGVAMELF